MATRGRKPHPQRTELFGSVELAMQCEARRDTDRLWFVHIPGREPYYTWAGTGDSNAVVARVARSLGWTIGKADGKRVTGFTDAQILNEAQRRGLIETNGDAD